MSVCSRVAARHCHLRAVAGLYSNRVCSAQAPAVYAALWSGRRCFAGTQVQTREASPPVPRGGLQAGVDDPSALVGFAERGGLLPRPETFDETLKPGFRGGRALFIFFLCNAVPFGSLLYYLREQRTQRTELSLLALPAVADDVAAEALRVIRTAAASFLMQAGTENGWTIRVDPHPPEGTAYVPPTEPLPLIPQVERNVLTDIFESPTVSGLGFVHFAISRASGPGAQVLSGDRKASLLYISNTRGAYCTVSGQVSVLTDPEARRRYWKNMWAFSFPANEAGAPAASAREESPPWQHGDYLLLRLAVDEVTLQSAVDGPQRWEQRRVQRRRGVGNDEAGSKWTLVTPQ